MRDSFCARESGSERACWGCMPRPWLKPVLTQCSDAEDPQFGGRWGCCCQQGRQVSAPPVLRSHAPPQPEFLMTRNKRSFLWRRARSPTLNCSPLAPTSLRAVRITRASPPPGRYMGSNYAFFGITMDTRPGPPTREHPHHIHSLEQLLPSAGPEEPLRSISLPAWVAKGVRSGNVQPKFGMCQGQTWWES